MSNPKKQNKKMMHSETMNLTDIDQGAKIINLMMKFCTNICLIHIFQSPTSFMIDMALGGLHKLISPHGGATREIHLCRL